MRIIISKKLKHGHDGHVRTRRVYLVLTPVSVRVRVALVATVSKICDFVFRGVVYDHVDV